jgi:hypothetical protein
MKLRLLLMACALCVSACASHPPAPCQGPFEWVNVVDGEVAHG